MKKILFLLLCTVQIYGQTSTGQEQEFDYGIKNNSTQTITTPTFIGTFGTDGTQGKIPSAYIEKTDNKQNSLAIDGTGVKYPTVDAVNAALPKSYSQIVYVNSTNPNTATIFDTANPPITNNNGLKVDTNNLYIGTDASIWVYDGIVFNYVTKSLPAISNFYIGGSTADAGSDKVQPIKRNGTIESTGFIKTGGTSSQALLANGSVLTNPISGTGTTNTIAKWTGTTTQGNSNITDNGTTVDINLPTSIKGTTASDGGQLGSELTTTATGTNWTGTGFATGYTHTTGDVTPLVSTLAAVANNLYQITWTITGRTTGSITINYGGIAISGITSSGNSGPKTTSTATLNIVPTTDFNGTVVLSIKVISPSVATTAFKNSSGAVTNEIRAHSSSSNFSIGTSALQTNTTGSYNSAVGTSALQTNTTGNNNIAIGYLALPNNTIGNNNSAIGYFALLNNTTGSSNSAIGQNALQTNTTGNNNSAVGQNALINNTSGGSNSAIGSDAGRYISNKSTPATILNNSIMLGYRTSPLADNQTNQVVIGYDATGLGSNTTVIGNSSTTTARVYGRQLVNTSTDNGTDQLQVNGTTKTAALTLATAPTTSAGTYDILTRNTSTGVVEKVLSSSVVGGSGTTNYLPKFTGANSLGNSLIYDNGTNVGIGTTSPNYSSAGRTVVDINGTSQSMLALSVGGVGKGFLFYTGTDMLISNENNGSIKLNTNGSQKAEITAGGNVLLGTTTDNGIDKLQVNGTITATGGTTANQVVVKSQLDGKVSLTGNETVAGNKTLSGTTTLNETIIREGYQLKFPKGVMYQSSVGTNALTDNRTVSFPDASGTVALVETVRPYKVYTALLSQTGTSAPTATVLENTLGGTVVWTRSNTGQYVGTLTGAFTDQKTIIFVNRSNPAATAFDTNMAANVININTVGYTTFSNSAYVDGQTNSASIEIRVYN